jgi:hypothetical protein
MAAAAQRNQVERRVLVGGGIALMVLTGLALWVQGEQTPPRGGEIGLQPPQVSARAMFVGADKCEACHQAPTRTYVEAGVTKFVELTESRTWREEDFHSRAFANIDPEKSLLARRMCEELGIADIHQEKRCLSCHADWRYDAKTQSWAERPAMYKLGVSCEACHGPASQWFLPHTDAKWRGTTPGEKQRLGMTDVRDPFVSAGVCLGCHVGNAAEGKFVMHEMYAAGHPPLVNFEFEAYAQRMPRHWRHVSEKEEFEGREAYITANPGATAGGKLHRARSALLAGVAAMRASLELTREGHAAEGEKIELAHFDCYACHHELQTPAWRQETQREGAPGRPRPAAWPEALVEGAIAFAHADPAAQQRQWREALAEYHAAYGARPFGDAARKKRSGEALQGVLGELVKALEATGEDQAALRRAFFALIENGEICSDYETARQIAWGAKRLYGGLAKKGDEQAAERIFAAWEKALVLDEPGRSTKPELLSSDKLKRAEEFRPAEFRREQAELKQVVSEE